jgi:SOS-response transcriptional repressor LexA
MRAGEKIKRRRELMGWTGDQFARKLGLTSRSYVSKLENGFAPITDKLRSRLGEVFGCPPAEFEDDTDLLRDQPLTPYGAQIRSVPVVGVVGAAEFMFNFDDPPLEVLPVVIERAGSRRYAAFRIQGDCMEPRFHDGEIVIVGESETVPDGVPGVFRLDAHCTLKIPIRHADRVELKPLNPRFKSIDVRTNKMVVVGVVVGVWRKP